MSVDGPGAGDDGVRPEPRIVVVPPVGGGAEGPEPDDEPGPEGGPGEEALVGQPAKVMRIGTMIKQLLEEVRSAPLDEAARARLATIHEKSSFCSLEWI